MLKPALTKLGVNIGFPAAFLAWGMAVNLLLADHFTWADQWQRLVAYLLAGGIAFGIGWLTLKHPEVETGIDYFDKKDD